MNRDERQPTCFQHTVYKFMNPGEAEPGLS